MLWMWLVLLYGVFKGLREIVKKEGPREKLYH